MKKTLALMLACVLAISLFPTAMAEDALKASTAELVVCTTSGEYINYMNETIVPKFNETYPGVKVTIIPDDNVEEKIAAGDLPNLYTGAFAARGMRYANNGLIVPLNTFDGFDELAARIDESYMVQFSDYNFYIPWNLTTTMMIYNKDLFRQAGLDPEQPPKTYDEFLDYAAKIDALGNDIKGCIFWNDALGWGGWYWDMVAPMYYNFNKGTHQLMNSMGTDVVFDKPEAQMKEFFDFLIQAKAYAPASMDDNNTFFNRKVGMWTQFGYGWKVDLASAADKPMVIGEDVGVAPIPVLNEGDTAYSTLGGNGLVIFKGDEEKQKLSWEFIKLLMDDELNLEACKRLGQIPSLTALQGDEHFKQPAEEPFVAQTLHAFQSEPFAEADAIANNILQAIQASVIVGDKTPEAAIADAATASRELLK